MLSKTLENIYVFAINKIVIDFVKDLEKTLLMHDKDDAIDYVDTLSKKYKKSGTLSSLLFKLKRSISLDNDEDVENYIENIIFHEPSIIP